VQLQAAAMVCGHSFSDAGTVKTVAAAEMLLIVSGSVPQLVMVSNWSEAVGVEGLLNSGGSGSDRLRFLGSHSRHWSFPGFSTKFQPATVDGESPRRAADQWGDLAGWQISGLLGSHRTLSAKC
jgi:hypothetical protein